jgi:hypothetical protein
MLRFKLVFCYICILVYPNTYHYKTGHTIFLIAIMRKILLSLLVAGFALSAQAQQSTLVGGVNGVRVTPLNATGDQPITITLDPTVICPDGTPGLDGAPIIRLHGGTNVNTVTVGWKYIVGAGPNETPDAITGFTDNGDGTWSKTLTPRTYFNVPADSTILKINFVLNGGAVGSNWDLRGKLNDPVDSVNCNDFRIPFPINARWAADPNSVRRAVNSSFSISSAQPNPFTGSTTLAFNMKRRENVNIRVMNILGETVEVLQNGVLNAGSQTATWKAGNAPAGVYFFSVQAGTNYETRKMMLVK